MWRTDKYLRKLDVSSLPRRWQYGFSLADHCFSRLTFVPATPALLQAALIVADRHQSLQITGNGDVLEPHDGIIAIGSGSPYALAAARALIDLPGMDALSIGEPALCGHAGRHCQPADTLSLL